MRHTSISNARGMDTLSVIKQAVIGGLLGTVIGAITTIPVALIVGVLLNAAAQADDATLLGLTLVFGLGFGAICGGISGPLIAVMTMSISDAPNEEDGV